MNRRELLTGIAASAAALALPALPKLNPEPRTIIFAVDMGSVDYTAMVIARMVGNRRIEVLEHRIIDGAMSNNVNIS